MRINGSMTLVGLLLLHTLACQPDKSSGPDTTTGDSASSLDDWIPPEDGDGDGYTTDDGDCDDLDSAVHPGADEDCNGIDDNCNDTVDEGYDDIDGDGIADCVDSEECDGIDNDGDGEIDEDFSDLDGDGLADCLDSEECDGIDNDGDGEIDEGYDLDGDGYTSCGSDDEEADCDDDDCAEFCIEAGNCEDGIDNDQNGVADCDDDACSALPICLKEICNDEVLNIS